MTYIPLFQEELKSDPFWMLVACSLVNLTQWKMARPVFDKLRYRCKNGHAQLINIPDEELVEILRPLGLHNRRASTLKRFAIAWSELMFDIVTGHRETDLSRHDIEKLPGCGKYAADSWEIFIEGNLDIETNDHRLNEYIERMKTF